MSFESLKARRGNTQKLVDELNKFDAPKNSKRTEDERFWKPTVDKAGNGYAVIRFLPALEEDNLVIPFVKTYDHGFQGPSGRWYIENSLTTIGKDDPVGQLNAKYWNSGLESDKEIARKQKRRLHYIGNILVVKDPSKPENEGKVFLYKFGAKIFAKIKEAMNPADAFEDEQQIIPYDFWDGANFKLKIRKVEGWPNYETSTFDTPSSVYDNDDEIEVLYKKINKLTPFVDPEGKDADGNPYFKSFDELKTKMNKVLDLVDSENKSTPNSHSIKHDANEPAHKVEKTEKIDESDIPWSSGATDEDDDDLAFFKKLASDQ